MDEELISPLETLMSMGAGGMMYAGADNAEGQPQLVLMVRDDPAHLATIPQDPPILAQVSLFRIDGVLLAPLVVKLGNHWYGTAFIAWAGEDHGLQALERLARDEDLMFQLYDGSSLEPVRVILFDNSLADGASDAVRAFQNAPTWSMEAFDVALEKMLQRFPHPRQIYDYGRG